MSAMDIDPDDGIPGPSQSNAARNAAAEELPSRTPRAEQLHEERKERVTSGQAESERMKHVQAYWKQIDDIISRGVVVQKAKEKIMAESIPEDVLVELGKAPVVNVQPVNRYMMLWKIMNEIYDSAEIERVPSPSNITQDSSSAGIGSAPPISSYPNNTNLPPSTPSPLPSNFYSDKLAFPECSWTVDFLLRYLCYPYTTSPIHPALRKSTGNPSNEVDPSQKGDLVLYGRFEGRKKEELLDLYQYLLYRRPILRVHLEEKLYASEKTPPHTPDEEKPPPPTTTPPPDEVDEIWEEVPEGDWILSICIILIVEYGVDRTAIAIQTLDPGFYKYNAALQPAPLQLYLLSQAFTQLVLALAEDVGESPLDLAAATLLQSRVEMKAMELELQDLVDEAKEKVSRHSNALNGLAQLAPAGSPEAVLERVERMSAKSRLGRAKYLARCERALGEPRSQIRLDQISAMADDPTCKVGNAIFPKGSDAWKWKIDYLELSLDGSSSAERMASFNNDRLANARQIKAERAAERASTTCVIDIGFGPEEVSINPAKFGIFVRYSGCNLTLDELFNRIIDPREANSERFDTDSSAQCLRIVRCVDCATVAVMNLPNAHHWCRNRDWQKIPVAMGDSNNLSLERLLWPYQLLQYPDLESLFLSWLDNQEQTGIRRSSTGAHFAVTKLDGNPRLEDVFLHHQSAAQHQRRNEDAQDLKRAEVESKKFYVAMLDETALL